MTTFSGYLNGRHLTVLVSAALLLACDGKPKPQPPLATDASFPATTSPNPTLERGKALDIKCPEAPRQLEKDIVVDAKGKIEGLASLTGATLEGKVSAITNDFISKYPNADKLLVAQLLMSATCETLKTSSTLSDSERLDRINSVNNQILQLFTASPKPDLRSRAERTEFENFGNVVWTNLRMSKHKTTTLHIFEPDCDVQVYVSEISVGNESSGLVDLRVPPEALVAKPFENFTHTFDSKDPVIKEAMFKSPSKIGDEKRELIRHAVETGEFTAMLVMRVLQPPCKAAYYIEYS